MNHINTTQVQSTNDASTISKSSAVTKNYFEDEFIQEFCDKKRARASLIHLGYYSRAVVLNNLVASFISFFHKHFKKIISCGAGFDTTYWKLSQANILNNSFYIEIDFSSVIQKKLAIIKDSKKLLSYINQSNRWRSESGINIVNSNFILLEADLCNINFIQDALKTVGVDFSAPTLFISECVITYMLESDSRKIISWMANSFENSCFLNYEQIHPEDGFGKVMLKHFDKLQSSLYSVSNYPDCESHYFRYKNLGFEKSFAISEWDALLLLTTEEERKRVFSLELFDEFEEFHLKCVHYTVAIAGKGVSKDWVDSFNNGENSKFERKSLEVEILNDEFELFRHTYCNFSDSSFIFGGCTKQSRSSKIYKINCSNGLCVNERSSSGHNDIKLDMVYGTVTYFEINNVPFVCLYGGRTSPDKLWNSGNPVVFEYDGKEFLLRLIIKEGNPVGRFRSSMVSLPVSEDEVHCWLFGGRTADINEPLPSLWRLSIFQNIDKTLESRWTEFKKKNHNWPCSRMSHSLTSCSKNNELFVIGGLATKTSFVLNDIWKWDCKIDSWERMEFFGKLLPRYGHTAHLVDDVIYVIGGVNTFAGMQPGIAELNLKNLTVTEYSLQVSISEPVMLFNHSSQLNKSDNKICIYIYGGGGNCFSFGTYLNSHVLMVKLK